MAIQGMNLPSIAGVLGFKDFTNQLNNANAGVRNAVGLVNDWAKMAAQNNQAEKQAQSQRDFTAEQNRINRDFQDAQQKARFEHELGMFEKQQARQLADKQATWQKDAEYITSLGYDDTNDGSMIQAQNNIRKIAEEGKAAGKSLKELEPLYQKINEIQYKRNELKAAKEYNNNRNDRISNIEKAISAGATQSARDLMRSGEVDGFLNQSDIDRLESLARNADEKYAEQRLNQYYNNKERYRKEKQENSKESAADFVSSLH